MAMLLTSCCSCASDDDSSALPHARTATHRPLRQWQRQHLAAHPNVGTSSAARRFLPQTAQASTTGARRSINQPQGSKDMSAPLWTALKTETKGGLWTRDVSLKKFNDSKNYFLQLIDLSET